MTSNPRGVTSNLNSLHAPMPLSTRYVGESCQAWDIKTRYAEHMRKQRALGAEPALVPELMAAQVLRNMGKRNTDFITVAEGLERGVLERLRDPQQTTADAPAGAQDDAPAHVQHQHPNTITTTNAIPDAIAEFAAEATSKRVNFRMPIVAIVMASLISAIALAGALVGPSRPDAATQDAIARVLLMMPTVSRW